MAIALHEDFCQIISIVRGIGHCKLDTFEKNDKGRHSLLPIDDVVYAVLTGADRFGFSRLVTHDRRHEMVLITFLSG